MKLNIKNMVVFALINSLTIDLTNATTITDADNGKFNSHKHLTNFNPY
jgi:hypothetical protein